MLASAEERHDSSGEEDGDIQLQMETLTLCTLDLRESEIYPAKHKRRRRRRKEGGKMQTEGEFHLLWHHMGRIYGSIIYRTVSEN